MLSCRHVGDLGNVMEDDEGKVEYEITSNIVMLSGEYTVVGRAFVVRSFANFPFLRIQNVLDNRNA